MKKKKRPYLQLKESSQNLLQYRTDDFEWQRTEFVLLEKVVQILLKHLKDKTCVVLVSKALVSAHEIPLG